MGIELASRLRAAGCFAGALGVVLALVNLGPLARGSELESELAPVANAAHDDTKVGFTHRVQGEKLLWEGDFGGAIESFAEAIRHSPESPPPYYFLNLSDPLRQRHERALRAKLDAIAAHAPKDAGTAYLMRGAHGWFSGDSEAALQDFCEAVRLAPERAAPYHLRAAAWLGKGEWQRTIRDYDEAIQRDAEDEIAYYSRGASRFWDGDQQGAIDDYSAALRLNPNNAVIFYLRGFASGADRDQAIQDYGEVIRELPEDSSGYYGRAGAWLMKGKPKEAIRDLDVAVRLEPDAGYIHYQRGVAWHQEGDLAKAVRDYSEALRLNPKNALAYYMRGVAWHKQNDFDQAARDLSEAIALNPEDTSAYYQRGEAWLRQGEFDRASQDFDQVIRLGPEDSTVASGHFGHGRVAWFKGDYAQAIEEYSKAIRQYPGLAHVHRARAFLYSQQADYDRAVGDYSEAISIGPAHASDYSSRARVWQDKGNLKLAIRDYDEAIRLQPDYARYYFSRGVALLGVKDYKSAIGDLDRAIGIRPERAAAYLIRGLAFDRMGNHDHAIKDFEDAVRLGGGSAAALGEMAWQLSAGPCFLRDGHSAVRLRDQVLTLESGAFVHAGRALALIETGELEAAIEAYETAVAPTDGEGESAAGSEGYRRMLIQTLQRALIRNGHASVAVNGVFDPATRDGLKSCVLAGCRPRLGVSTCAEEGVPPPSRNLQAALERLASPQVVIEGEH